MCNNIFTSAQQQELLQIIAIHSTVTHCLIHSQNRSPVSFSPKPQSRANIWTDSSMYCENPNSQREPMTITSISCICILVDTCFLKLYSANKLSLVFFFITQPLVPTYKTIDFRLVAFRGTSDFAFLRIYFSKDSKIL